MSDKKMSDEILEQMFREIVQKRSSCLGIIRDAVSMSSVENKIDDVSKNMKWLALKFKEAGGSVTMLDPETAGKTTKAPPVLTAFYRASSSKPTLLVYGLLKLENVRKESGDASLQKCFVLFGNRIASKGSLLCWIDAIRTYRSNRVELPLNIRFVVACIDDVCTSELFGFFKDKKHIIYKDVELVCVPYSSGMMESKPSIVCGYRGCCKFHVTVECAGHDLYTSGNHSGMVQEAVTDVVALLSSLVNSKGEVLISNIRDGMKEVTLEEENACQDSAFDVIALKRSVGCTALLHKDDKKRVLMHSTRFPSVSIHGIETGQQLSNDVIPCKATGIFSIRIVPDQKAITVSRRVTYHLKEIFSSIKSRNKLTIEQTVGINPLLWDHKGPNFQAARKAVMKVVKQNVDFVRQGTSYPLVADLQEISEKDILLLPVGYYNCDKAQSNREEADVEAYIDGIKIVIAYIFELSRTK